MTVDDYATTTILSVGAIIAYKSKAFTEHCPPDVGAAFIWLKNRDPEHWRDVQNVEHVMGKYLISDKPMTIDEWAAARATVVNEVIDDTKELPAPKAPT